MTDRPIIHWFRLDLRLADHPALTKAVRSGAPIVPVFILAEANSADGDAPWAIGGASRWWLHQRLASLAMSLKTRGSRLILRAGDPVAILTELASDVGAGALHFTRRYEPSEIALETRVRDAMTECGVDVRRFSGSLLFEPESVRTKNGDPYKVFTPYYRACLGLDAPRKPLPAPKGLQAPKTWPTSLDLGTLDLVSKQPDWAGGLRETWTPGEAGGLTRLKLFLDEAAGRYDDQRNRPDVDGTSCLSPYLHWGEISPNQAWHAGLAAEAAGPSGDEKGIRSFLRELIWREFSYHLLVHWPHLPERAFRPEFDAFPWRNDPAALNAWQKGRTGYPIVDAGMRQLWHTGWMHNRVRMVTASFLIKHLLLPWQAGEAWFWDTLVDADLASNSASWQWVAGSGADAAPYFRIFNPITQGEKFDPKGIYIRRWVPELADLPDAHLNAPWEAPADVLRAAGVTLGETYPRPLVDHRAARTRALEAYDVVKAAKV